MENTKKIIGSRWENEQGSFVIVKKTDDQREALNEFRRAGLGVVAQKVRVYLHPDKTKKARAVAAQA